MTDKDALNGVYRERNQVVAALSKCFYSWLGEVNDPEPGFRYAVYMYLPHCGQVSWHIPDEEVDELFGHLNMGGGGAFEWDGHDTEEKYRRLNALPQVWWQERDEE